MTKQPNRKVLSLSVLFAALSSLATFPAGAQSYTIRTAAGGGIPALLPGSAAPGGGGAGVALDSKGNVFYVGSGNTTIWRLDASTSLLTRVAGNGGPGSSGDGGSAIDAQMVPVGIALDAAGGLYIADAANNRIRKVSNGIVTTVAGNGTYGFSGDNGLAVNAQIGSPLGVAVDSAGALYIADTGNNRVRKVVNGVISTMAGNGAAFLGGDNGPALLASFSPVAIALDADRNLYIADSNNRIRKVTAATGVISTIAGSPGSNAPGSFGGDGGPATSALLSQPRGISIDSTGTIYIADSSNHRIRKITNGIITTIAGSGATGGLGGFGGDNGPATNALLSLPTWVAIGPDGSLFIGDSNNSRVRKISNGFISTWIGPNSVTDNAPATSAWLPQLAGVAIDSSGTLFFSDGQNRSIRKVSSGVISTVAGGGSLTDNFPAIGAQIPSPRGVAVDSAGNLYISDNVTNNIRKVSKGVITTVAGTGTFGYSGDGGPGTSAQLASPSGIAVDSAGNLYIADTNNNRVRKLSNGVITTFAGDGGLPGFGGDNGPATSAQLNFPSAVALDSTGNLYIADGNRIRRVSNGIITTVAGGSTPGFSGDNGPAPAALLSSPVGIALDAAGNLYIADVGNRRVRKISGGTITTIAGNGTPDFLVDNSPATGGGLGFFLLNQPFVGITVDSAGTVYFTDSGRVRILVPSTACATSARPLSLQIPAIGGNFAISVQTDPTCPWSIAGLPNWLTLVSATPTGSGLVAVTLFATGSTDIRSALLFAAGDQLRLDQTGGAITPAIVSAVTNSGSNRGGPVSPGEIVVVYGSGMGPSQLASFRPGPSGSVATSLAGTQIFFNGIPAPMIYTSATQAAAVVPYGVAGLAQLTVIYAPTQAVATALVPATAAVPGVFTLDSTGKGPAAALNLDGSVNSPAKPAHIGGFISLFLTGEGQTWPAGVDGKPASDPLPLPLLPVNATVGGKPANVTYAGGAPGLVAGVMQVNIRIPAGIAPGNSVPLTIQVGGILSQSDVTVAVTN